MKNKKPSERIEDVRYIYHTDTTNPATISVQENHEGVIDEIGKILDEMQEKIDKLSLTNK